jgi:hypothetical protein
MAGKLLVVDEAAAGACRYEGFASSFLIAGRTEDALFRFPLAATLASRERLGLGADGASAPYALGLSCSPDGTLRAWAGYQRGRDASGYVAQVDLADPAAGHVVVNLGKGQPRSFAYDRDHDRLYVSTQEYRGRAPIRWITVGRGCKRFENGVQDERQGGCHVDPGFDLSLSLAGAEPNELALSTELRPCTLGPYAAAGMSCRRMYMTMRIYDADLLRLTGYRPTGDVGGKLVVLELPESGQGGPDPQWVRGLDIGVTAGQLLVLPRGPGRGDLVVATALEDHLVWIYDDETGTLVKVFGRDTATGVPALGHHPAGLAAQDLGDGTVRVFVASYKDHWVSAIDVPLEDPEAAEVVTGADGQPVHLGRRP